MASVVVLICKECYVKIKGELKSEDEGRKYVLENKIGACEKCGKVDCLITTTEPIDAKKIKYNFLSKL